MYEVLHQLCLISLCRALLLLTRRDPTQQNILWEGGDYWDRGGEVYRMSSKIWIQAMLKLNLMEVICLVQVQVQVSGLVARSDHKPFSTT